MAKKGLNMEKVAEIRNEVEEVMETNYTCSDCGVKLKHEEVFLRNDFIYCDKCSTKIDELENLLNDEVEEMKEMNKIEEMEMNKMNEIKNKVDNGIKYAILRGKDAQEVAKYVPGKQLLAIFKSYKEITGVDMNDTQKNYLKTLNSKQLSNILHTLNVAREEFSVA